VLPPQLADANIPGAVIAFLRSSGVDIVTIAEIGASRWTDDRILAASIPMRRFVLTHDGDFGRLAVGEGKPYHGILLLRPGDRPPDTIIESLRPLLSMEIDWRAPMIAVHRGGRIRVRRPGKRQPPGGR